MRVSRRRSPPLPPLHGHHKRPQSSTMVGGRGRFKCYAPAILGHARRCRAPQGLRIGCVGLPWAAVAPSTAIFYTNFTLIFTGGGSFGIPALRRIKRSPACSARSGAALLLACATAALSTRTPRASVLQVAIACQLELGLSVAAQSALAL